MSKNFFKKEWCKKELNALFSKKLDNTKNKIFPIWFEVNVDNVKRYSLLIADIKAIPLEKDNIKKVVNDICKILGES